MITVEDLLMAYASAYDAWLDPEAERKNPTPEYAELIRQAVSFENAKLRELLHEALLFGNERSYQEIMYRLKQQARELGVEVDA